MTVQDICNRCSKFSGWHLTVTVAEGVIRFEDPNDTSGHSWLHLYADPHLSFGLIEAYGRMRHWGITLEEQMVMRSVLNAEIAASIEGRDEMDTSDSMID